MLPNVNIFEQLLIYGIWKPLDLQGATGSHVDGDWIDTGPLHAWAWLLYKNIGTDGDDPTLTFAQATSSAGAGSKALNVTTIYRRESLVSEGLKSAANLQNWTVTTQSAAATFTHVALAQSECLIGFYFRTDQLDVSGGFRFVNVTTADVGSNAQLGALLFLGLPREINPVTVQNDLRS